MRIKHSGQRAAPTNPKHNAGVFFAFDAKRAACMCGGKQPPIYVDITPVRVSFRNKRRVVTPTTL